MSGQPTFADMRRRAFALLGDARDELNSVWREGTGPTANQLRYLRAAQDAIAKAKSALDAAARQ